MYEPLRGLAFLSEAFSTHALALNRLRTGRGLRVGTILGAMEIQSSDNRSASSNHAWMMRHLSCPRDWKSSSDDPTSWSSWKNFNESFPVGPSWLDSLR